MAALLTFFLTALQPLDAHEALDSQIATLTARIESDPTNAALFLKRGELHRARGERQAALDDYDRAARLDPEIDVLDLVRAKLFLQAGEPKAARLALDRFLVLRPDHPEARLVRARALVKLGDREAAVGDFNRAIALEPRPQPDAYIERAQAIADQGEQRIDEALRGLDEGINRLGSLVTLELCAIDLELRRRRYDSALSRLDRISAQSPRKESWLAQRSEILELAGREGEARAAALSALAAIEALPPQKHATRAMGDLESRVRAALQRMDARGSRRQRTAGSAAFSRHTP